MTLQAKTNRTTKIKRAVSGLRILGMTWYVQHAADMYKVMVKIESHGKGLFFETVTFSAEGEAANMEKFARLFPQAQVV